MGLRSYENARFTIVLLGADTGQVLDLRYRRRVPFAVNAGHRAGRTGRAGDLLRLKRAGHRQKNASEDTVEDDVSSQFH